MEHREPTTMARAAVRPRLLVMLVVLLAAAAVCARLGVWQLDRAQAGQRAADSATAATAAPAVPIDDVLPPQTSFRSELVGREVTVTGTYEPDGQLLVPGREVDGQPGYLVLTPLRVASGGGADGGSDGGSDGGAAVLPVVRGWVGSADAGTRAPSGTVRVRGYLQPSEASGELDTAGGTTDAVSSAQLVNVWGGPIYSGYLVLAGSEPAQPDDLALLPRPDAGEGGGLDLRNLGYAAQWWIFAVFALALWLRLVRDEAHGEPRPGEMGQAAGPAAGSPAHPTGEPGGDGAVDDVAGGGSGPRVVRSSEGVDASP